MSGLCTPWVTAEEVATCCAAGETPSSDEIAAAQASAMVVSEILFELSGRRWNGGECVATVRPAPSQCTWPLQVLEGSGVVVQWYAAGYFGGWGWGWGWGSLGGPYAPLCGCSGLSQVKLSGYPVREILEVTIGPDTIDPSGYRLDHARMLTRLADADGNARAWPSCQRLDKNLGEHGTFGVTYRYGVAPPAAGVLAAKALACEIATACLGGDCRLPFGTTKVVSQGVTVERGLISQFVVEGRTGLPEVDLFMTAYGAGRRSRRPSVWSPDMLPYARSFGNPSGT